MSERLYFSKYIRFVITTVAILLFLVIDTRLSLSDEVKRFLLPSQSKSGDVYEIEFTANKHRSYYIDIDFLFGNEPERLRASELVGEIYNVCEPQKTCGVETKFSISIEDQNGNIIVSDVKPLFGPQGKYAFDPGGRYLRNIGVVLLKPGNYIAKITAHQLDERIHLGRAEITMRFNPQASVLGE